MILRVRKLFDCRGMDSYNLITYDVLRIMYIISVTRCSIGYFFAINDSQFSLRGLHNISLI